jgi:multisubunit Na+/H+ antiporter MnhF subunit
VCPSEVLILVGAEARDRLGILDVLVIPVLVILVLVSVFSVMSVLEGHASSLGRAPRCMICT